MNFEFDEDSPLTYEEQIKAWQLTRDTVDFQLTSDRGSAPIYPGRDGEQYDARHQQTTAITKRTKPTAAQLCRRMSRHQR